MHDYMKIIINAIKAWTPIKSVNGKIGDIVLTAEDIGAVTKEYVDNLVASEIAAMASTTSTIYFDETEPTDLQANDLWFEPIN